MTNTPVEKDSKSNAPQPSKLKVAAIKLRNSARAFYSGIIKPLIDRSIGFTKGLFSASSAFWAIIFSLLFYQIGGFELLLPSSSGIILVESPQIYTRERLVNDRFREKAWLEKQLRNSEEQERLISSIIEDSLKLRLSQVTHDTDIKDDGTASNGSNGKGVESKVRSVAPNSLVSAQDAFQKQRNTRSVIRRALIENELDDRHDLGGNSLYQFNFGGAIIAGSRTRKIASIEMEFVHESAIRPLDGFIKSDKEQCHNLKEFECAYLLDKGYLTETSKDDTKSLVAYRRWRTLYHRWIAYENKSYLREAEIIGKLLQSTNAENKKQILRKLNKFFATLQDKLTSMNKEINAISELNTTVNCAYNMDITDENSIEYYLRKTIKNCIKIISNEIETGINNDNYPEELKPKPSKNHQSTPATKDGSEQDNSLKANDKEKQLEKFYRNLLLKLNSQCSPREPIVLLNENLELNINPKIEGGLVQCIVNGIIRDLGSHPFARMLSLELSDKGSRAPLPTTLNRMTRSQYGVTAGLAGTVSPGRYDDVSFSESLSFVGLAIQKRKGTSSSAKNNGETGNPILGLEIFEINDKLKKICGNHQIPANSLNPEGPPIGITGGYNLNIQVDRVDISIGKVFLSHLVCHTIKTGGKKFDYPFVNDIEQVPIGLFRFIETLSQKQNTFSYSVVPSGTFDLQQRVSNKSLQISSLFDKANIKAGSESKSDQTWINKHYKIVGYSSQTNSVNPTNDTLGARIGFESPKWTIQDALLRHKALEQTRARFGWFIFPTTRKGFLLNQQAMESANFDLSVLVSLPAWWENVGINITKTWRNSTYPGAINEQSDIVKPEYMRINLPSRLEFLRNYFPDATSNRPSLYNLQIPQITLLACKKAKLLLKGERLWRSTVVTLGSQKSDLIEVMPNMSGIIAEFNKIIPPLINPSRRKNVTLAQSFKEKFSDFSTRRVPVAIWTSEGERTLSDSVEIAIPAVVQQRILKGIAPCEDTPKNISSSN